MESSSSSDLIFQIRRNNSNRSSEDVEVENENQVDFKFLSVIWKSGKLGAAFYNCAEKTLYVYEEISDPSPQFFLTSSVYREVMPKFLITIGKSSDDFVKHLIDVVLAINDTSATTDTVRNLPSNMFLLTSKEYSFEICRSVLSDLNLINTEKMPELERELFMNSLLNFDNKTSVYAAGALIKYLDKNWAHFLQDKDDVQILYVSQITQNGHLLMDLTTLNALQVFHQCSHDASFKRGLQSSNREGLSIYKLFSSSCKSKLGQMSLRNLLIKPLNDKNELTKRLDFVNFVLHPSHQEYVEALQDNIKNLSDVTMVLSRIKNSRATCRDWRSLYKSIYHTVFLRELTSPYQDTCALLNEFYDSVTMELIGLENSINNAIDFTDNKSLTRPIIKLGLDESLDAKKLQRQNIAQHVTAAAELAAQQLPDYLHECAIVYLPEMGHLISVKEWEPNCDPESLKDLGFHFMFTLRGMIHYKNPLCLELDESLGDINGEIIAHENRILQRLSSFILKYNRDIREPLRILSLIDALIAVAKVSAQNNYIRPSLNTNNTHEIYDCRHPLLELVSNFESNDFFSGKKHSHIKVITGPNGSGKSVYLKEVALVIYLAHIGSYVPAKAANIAMMHSMHSRIQATESASVRLSAFMIDAIQATQALHSTNANSLILLDEFGRGTTMDEGFALLLGFLQYFYKKGKNCPHILVSTHHQNISEYLPSDALVDHLQMAHTENNGIVSLLYKVIPGISNSFAFNIAAQIGIDGEIIQRARELFEDNKNATCTNRKLTKDESLKQFLENVEIPDLDD